MSLVRPMLFSSICAGVVLSLCWMLIAADDDRTMLFFLFRQAELFGLESDFLF